MIVISLQAQAVALLPRALEFVSSFVVTILVVPDTRSAAAMDVDTYAQDHTDTAAHSTLFTNVLQYLVFQE